MAVVLAEYTETIVGPGGTEFRARACALPTPRGAWHGWIEFDPVDGAPRFRSPRETEQPSRLQVADWAGQLTARQLERALARALGRIGESIVLQS